MPLQNIPSGLFVVAPISSSSDGGNFFFKKKDEVPAVSVGAHKRKTTEHKNSILE
jgi:hypothetical protein